MLHTITIPTVCRIATMNGHSQANSAIPLACNIIGQGAYSAGDEVEPVRPVVTPTLTPEQQRRQELERRAAASSGDKPFRTAGEFEGVVEDMPPPSASRRARSRQTSWSALSGLWNVGENLILYGQMMRAAEDMELPMAVVNRLCLQGMPPATVSIPEYLARFASYGWDAETDAKAWAICEAYWKQQGATNRNRNAQSWLIQDDIPNNSSLQLPTPGDYLSTPLSEWDTRRILDFLPYEYIVLYHTRRREGGEGEFRLPWRDPQGVREVQREWLRDLFLGSAALTNYPAFTRMSDNALGTLMFSTTHNEADAWDSYLNIPVTGSHFSGQTFFGGVGSWFSPFHFLRRTSEVNAGVPERLAGSSYGMSNIYPQMADEAWTFMNQVAPEMDWDAIGPQTGIFAFHPRDINTHPFFSARVLGLIFDWAGARQQIQEGAGTLDVPAIEDWATANKPEEFGVKTVSAYSLVMGKNIDTVDIAYDPATHYNNDERNRPIKAVEQMPSAAATLGLLFVTDASQIPPDVPRDQAIVLFDDFIPYNETQTMELINYFANSTPENKELLENDTDLVLLKLSVEHYFGMTVEDYLASQA